MKLRDMLTDIEYTVVSGDVDCEISSLVYDSRKVSSGSAFCCIVGANSDGHDYAAKAVEMGAAALIVTKDVTEAVCGAGRDVAVIKVNSDRDALARLSAAWFGHPAEKLTTIGITGTKGKTTTSYMVYEILKRAGRKPGLIGTIESVIGDERIPAANTTPESYVVQESFAKMVEKGCDCVVMEVSSQGLMQKRVGGFVYDIGVFTNMSPDHIGPNEHESFEEYMACKGLLFKQCRRGLANVDDEHMETVLAGHTCELTTFGTADKADIKAKNIDLHSVDGKLGVSFTCEGEGKSFPVKVNIPGKFTVYNSLTAIAVAMKLGIDEASIAAALPLVSVKGRVEPIRVSDEFSLMIDYAHNAMALDSLLGTLLEYKPERLVCLFGCGGNRSRDRRFEMGEISSKLADLTIVTSDNPRFEKPEDIIADIIVGVKRGGGEYVTVPDRKDAIMYAIKNAKKGDVIVLAGKGHEDYQEICGKKYHMDERELVREVCEELIAAGDKRIVLEK